MGCLAGTLSEERNWAGKRGKDAAQVFPCNAKHLPDMLMSVLHSIISDTASELGVPNEPLWVGKQQYKCCYPGDL